MFKATVDGIVFEVDTAQNLGIAVATYKNGLIARIQANGVSSSSTVTASTTI